MRFKIVSAGWQCAQYAERTLGSIAAQNQTNWDLGIVVDPCDDGTADVVEAWVDDYMAGSSGPNTITLTANTERHGAVRNQYEMIMRLRPHKEDVIVFLDLDGDQLAHPDVLAHLEQYYADGTLVTYGNYRPVPDDPGCQPPRPFPDDVVRGRRYRKYLQSVYCAFNHLRTMKGKVFDAIPLDQFMWHRGPHAGEWYPAGTDYAFMAAALEVADGRYRCVDEVLCLYNAANPQADWRRHGELSSACHQDILRRRPLPRIEV